MTRAALPPVRRAVQVMGADFAPAIVDAKNAFSSGAAKAWTGSTPEGAI